MDSFNSLKQVSVFILGLITLSKTFLVRRFDADENSIESGSCHQIHEFRIVGQIVGGLREKNTSLFLVTPLDESG